MGDGGTVAQLAEAGGLLGQLSAGGGAGGSEVCVGSSVVELGLQSSSPECPTTGTSDVTDLLAMTGTNGPARPLRLVALAERFEEPLRFPRDLVGATTDCA